MSRQRMPDSMVLRPAAAGRAWPLSIPGGRAEAD
jgi:hypothetical protein